MAGKAPPSPRRAQQAGGASPKPPVPATADRPGAGSADNTASNNNGRKAETKPNYVDISFNISSMNASGNASNFNSSAFNASMAAIVSKQAMGRFAGQGYNLAGRRDQLAHMFKKR